MRFPPARNYRITFSMVQSINNVIQKTKRKPGRPKKEGGPAKLIALRLPLDTAGAVDAWAEKNEVTRSTAIRRLVELGLKAKGRK